jgi:hypothetical protein
VNLQRFIHCNIEIIVSIVFEANKRQYSLPHQRNSFERNLERLKKRREREKKRIQDVVQAFSSNTIASIQQVSEDNLKEFLVSILCL